MKLLVHSWHPTARLARFCVYLVLFFFCIVFSSAASPLRRRLSPCCCITASAYLKSLSLAHLLTSLTVYLSQALRDGCDNFSPRARLALLLYICLSSCFFSVGGKLPLEAIFVSCSCKGSSRSPTVVVLHGGPHSVSVSSYSKSSAFLASLGFNLLVVNYRYSSSL